MPTPEEFKKAREAYTKNPGSAATPSDEAKTYMTMLAKEAGVKVPDGMILTMRPVKDDDKMIQYVIQDKNKNPVVDIDIPFTPTREEDGIGPVVRKPGKDNPPGEVIQNFDKDDKKTDKKVGLAATMQDTLMALANAFKSEIVPPGTSLASFKAPGNKERSIT